MGVFIAGSEVIEALADEVEEGVLELMVRQGSRQEAATAAVRRRARSRRARRSRPPSEERARPEKSTSRGGREKRGKGMTVCERDHHVAVSAMWCIIRDCAWR
jgi:hypothetical protein